MQELQNRVQEAKWFTKLDLKNGFNLIRIRKGDEWKTAFRTRYGLYEFQVMPFGLTNAPSTFQDMMNHVFSNMIDLGLLVYMDDFLIYARTEEEHDQRVKEVLKRLQENRLAVSSDKCVWKTQEVEFLGYVIGQDGIKMAKGKVEAVLEWKTPASLSEVQSFGICQLLPTLHQGLLLNRQTPNGANERRKQGVGMEPMGGRSLLGAEASVHNSTNTCPLRRHQTSNHRDRRLRLRHRRRPVTKRWGGETTPGCLPLPKVPAGGNQLRNPQQETSRDRRCLQTLAPVLRRSNKPGPGVQRSPEPRVLYNHEDTQLTPGTVGTRIGWYRLPHLLPTRKPKRETRRSFKAFGVPP